MKNYNILFSMYVKHTLLQTYTVKKMTIYFCDKNNMHMQMCMHTHNHKKREK